MPADVARDLAGSGGSRPEVSAGTNAALPHFDHDGHLRADCVDCPARSDRQAVELCATSTLFHYCSTKRGVSVLKKELTRIESTTWLRESASFATMRSSVRSR